MKFIKAALGMLARGTEARKCGLIAESNIEICNEKNPLLGCKIPWFCQFSAQTLMTSQSQNTDSKL